MSTITTSDDNVIDLTKIINSKRPSAKYHQPACPCDPENPPLLLPVVEKSDSNIAFIAALACTKYHAILPVVNGIIHPKLKD